MRINKCRRCMHMMKNVSKNVKLSKQLDEAMHNEITTTNYTITESTKSSKAIYNIISIVIFIILCTLLFSSMVLSQCR